MGYIYKMTNKVNGKIYIGQTRTSIEERMRKHYSDAKWEKEKLTVNFILNIYNGGIFHHIWSGSSVDQSDGLLNRGS